MRKGDRIVIGELNGRNGADPPLAVPDDQAVEMLNVDRWDGMLGRKRGGSDLVTQTGGTAFSSGIQSLFRHVPGADETAAELWGIDGAATPIVKRMAGGTSFANVTLKDAIATRPQDATAVTLNGKLFVAYDSTQDRLHAWDGSTLRRVGLATPAAPTVANGATLGAYAATLRYYRVRWVDIVGAVRVRRSEPSPSVSFTPDGAHAFARITQPTPPNEGETHWEIEVSTDNATFYIYAGDGAGSISGPIAIGTTTGDDAQPVASISAYGLSAVAGTFSLPTSAKYLVTDGNRLLLAGAWESGGKNSRVWYTPVLGSLDQGDDERIPNTTNQKNYLDLNENDGGGITGLAVLNGVPIAFKYRQIYRLTPTGDVGTPYLPKRLIDGIGCVAHKSIAIGEDEVGRPALYFASHRGAYRLVLSAAGFALQYLGRDNEDLIINLGATTVVAHSVYYPAKHQWWLWFATGSNNDPDTLLVFDPLLGEVDQDGRVRKGWFRWSGDLAIMRCACLCANTLGASMSRDLKPYSGYTSGTLIYKADTSNTQDANTSFQAYVKTKPIAAAPLGTNAGVSDALLLAEVGSGVTITLTLDRDYGLETRTSTVLLTASASETRTLKKFEGSAMSGAGTIQAQIGDGSALATAWVLDALVLPTTTQETR